ncbi:MAG: hypothetical protein KKG99_09535 [Bacteroidetes bacterium]|nr:hypothetical protein [Bacteroidota bacterium]
MKQKAKLLSVLLLFLMSMSNLFAQEEPKESHWSMGVDFTSRYIWRGLNLGASSPSIQPYLEFGFGSENHAFTIGAWGAYSTNGTQTGQEADIYLTYTLNQLFTFTLTDYFFPDETSGRNDYFNRNMNWDKINHGDKDQTGHIVEAALAFNGTEKFPISIMFAINIWGADSRKYIEQSGVMVPEDKIVMSKYLEFGYSTEIQGTSLDFFAGLALDNPKTERGEPTGFYGQENAGLVNLGLTLSKEIQISDKFSLPVSASLITNPEAGNIFMVFAVSL